MSETDSNVALFSRCWREADRFREKDIETVNPFTGNGLNKPWYYYDRLYRGYQWDFMTIKNTWVSRPVKNIIAMTVEGFTTMLTDNNPAVSIVPREPSDTDLADVVKAAMEHWWDIEAMQSKIALAVKASRIYGVGWLMTYYDNEAKKVKCKVVHPDNVWVDPDTTVEDYDPTYLIYKYRSQVGALKKQLPDADWENFNVGWKAEHGTTKPTHDRDEDNNNPARSTTVYQFWYKDPERIVWDDESLLKDKVVKRSKPKFPRGKVITIAGGITLDERENPYEHGEIPFTPVHAYPVPGKFYGMGDVQNVLNIQVMRNRMSQYIFDQTLKSGGGYALVGANSGIDPNKITNAPFQIVPCRDVNQFRMERAPQPSRHVFDYIYMLDKDADDVVGMHDISRGVFTPGNKSAAEAMMLGESDRTRVRSASRWLVWALRRSMRQVMMCWAQWDETSMMVRIAGKDIIPDASVGGQGEMPRYAEFKGEMLKRKDGSGAFTKENVELDLVIADTSTLPATQQEENNKIGMLLQWQVITPEDVLKYKLVDIPHASEILADRQLAMSQAPPTEQMPPSALGPSEGQVPFQDELAQMSAESGIPVETLAMMLEEEQGALLG